MSTQITLNGKQYEIGCLPLGRMRVLLPAFNRAGRAFGLDRIDEAAMDDIVTIIANGIGLPVAEVELIPTTLPELIAAVDAIADVCGLKPPPEGSPAGEALRALASIGTSSTPGS